MIPQSSKYFRQEWERRFKVGRLEADVLRGAQVIEIEDVYLPFGRLRLRRMAQQGAAEIYKLTQKFPATRDGVLCQDLTTIYLDRGAYEGLSSALTGLRLRKHRHRLAVPNTGLAVDVFLGALDGLVLAEIEFTDAAAMKAFVPPPWTSEDVTENQRYSGFALARDGLPA